MNSRKNIDSVFQEIFGQAGPKINEHDEARFLENMRALRNNKKRRGFFLFFTFIVFLGAATGIWYTVGHKHVNARKTETAVTTNNTSKFEVEDKASNMPFIQQNEANAIHSNQSSAYLDRFQLLKISGGIKSPEILDPAPNSIGDEIPDIEEPGNTTAEIQENNFRFDLLHSPATFPTFTKISFTEYLGNGAVNKEKLKVKFPRKPLFFNVGIISGMIKGNADWKATANENSHKELENFAKGSKGEISGFNFGIEFTQNIKRFQLQSGIIKSNISITTVYKNNIHEIPVLDSASGRIIGYLQTDSTKGIALPSQRSNISMTQIPLRVGYEFFKNGRNSVSANIGAVFSITDSNSTKAYNLLKFEKESDKASMKKTAIQAGVRYQYTTRHNFTFGAAISMQRNRWDYVLYSGRQRMYMQSFNFAPFIFYNF